MNIHQAVISGNNDLVKQILANDPAQVNQILELKGKSTIRKVTPIFLAAIAGQIETLKLLLDNNASLEIPESGENLFEWALLSNARRKVCKIVASHFPHAHGFVQETTLIRMQTMMSGVHDLLKTYGVVSGVDQSGINYYLWLGETASVKEIEARLQDENEDHDLLGIYLGALAQQNQPVLDFLFTTYGCDQDTTVPSGPLSGLNSVGLAAYAGYSKVLPALKKLECDFFSSFGDGPNQGKTPASLAARSGHVEVLRYLHSIGCDLNAPITSGQSIGATLAYIATGGNHLNVLQYLNSIGCNLSAPLASGENQYFTVVDLAVNRDHIEILHYLKSIGCKLDEPTSGGPLKGLTPLHKAISLANFASVHFYYENGYEFHNELFKPKSDGSILYKNLLLSKKFDVLNKLNSMGIIDLDRPFAGLTPSKLPGYKKLTTKERVELTYYQLHVHETWFLKNTDRFIREMDHFSSEDWVQGRSVRDVIDLYKKYLQVGGQNVHWLMNALVHWINHSTPLTEEEMNDLFMHVDLKNCSLDIFREAVRPGPHLLELLKRMSDAQTKYGNDQLMHLEQWLSLLLKQMGGTEEFWTQAMKCFQTIRNSFAPRKGKVKGKQAKADSFALLWKKFDQKIRDTVASPEDLQAVIDLKDRDLSKQFLPLPQKISDDAEKLERKWKEVTFSDAEDPIEKECLAAKAQRVSTFLDQVRAHSKSEKESLDQIRACFLKHDFRALNKISTLQDAVNAVGSKLLAEGKTKVVTAKAQFSDMERRLEADLATLEQTKDFRLAQREMLQAAIFESHLLPTKYIRKKVKAREAAVWEEHLNALSQAQTISELQTILQATEMKWNEVGQLLKPANPSRAQRIEDYKDQKILEQKQEIDRLVQEVEQLKQSALRAPSPEKKIPVVEEPLQIRLIRKLEEIAFNPERAAEAPQAQKALKMLEKRGDVLPKVRKIEKFLALFQISYDRTAGSHSTYTDGQAHVVIADHDGDSKDYQIKAALEAVYKKLTTKK